MAVNRNNPTPVTDPGGISGSSYATKTADNLKALWDTTLGICTVNGASGGANEIHLDPPFTDGLAAYASPMGGYFKPTQVNTAAVQINVNGLGLRDLVRPDGVALAADDLDVRLHHFVFDDVENRAVLLSYLEQVIPPDSGSLKKAWSFDTSETSFRTVGGTLWTMTLQAAGGDVLVLPRFTVVNTSINASDRTDFRLDFYIDDVLEESSPIIAVTSGLAGNPVSFDLLEGFVEGMMNYVIPDSSSHTYRIDAFITNTDSGGMPNSIAQKGLGYLYDIEQAFV